MATGFFLGGMADARESRLQRALEADRLAADTSLRERGLGLQERQIDAETAFRRDDLGLRRRALSMQERQMQSAAAREMAAQADAAIAETMKYVAQGIEQGLAAGRDPEFIRQGVSGLLADAQEVAAMAGRDPARLGLMVDTMLAGPGAAEMATATGRTTAAGMLGQAAGLQAGGIDQARAEATAGIEGGGGGGMFGDSEKAMALEQLVRSGVLTFEQAVQQAAGVAPSDTQAISALYADRMHASNRIIDAREEAGLDFWGKTRALVPLAGNIWIPPELRQLVQAQRDFVNAVLRRESGAVINPSEFASAEAQYFPTPGDDPETLAQKRENRRLAIAGLSRAAGPTYRPADSGPATSSSAGDLPPGATEQDMQVTMQETGLTRAQVIEYLRARMQERFDEAFGGQ